MWKYLLISLLIFSGVKTNATHIVGGYFSYKCLGSVNSTQAEYEITFRMYRDCKDNSPQPPNAQFDNLIPITIYNPSNVLLRVDTFFLGNTDTIPNNINNPCVVSTPDICVQEGVYLDTILLPRNQTFELVFQRCCRNNQIDNVPSPSSKGSTFTISVPSFNSVGCNSSPEFNQFPPIVLCSQFDVDLDLSATDDDNDSLVYSFCAPYDYTNQTNPLPTPAFSPPYNFLPFQSPQTATNPIPSNPQMAIDSKTGIVSGTPTSLGKYVVGFCVEEYRNGVLLSTTRRDIQISTGNCNPAIINAVQNQTQLCTGLGVNFTNQSSSPDLDTLFYFWNFGDPTTLADTSTDKDPFYTYPDTGNYTITLIVNPGFSCADTSTIVFRVDSVLNPRIEQNGNFCASGNSIDYAVGGVFESTAAFEWTFEPQANVITSNQDSVFNVSYPGSGKYYTTLKVTQKNCSESRLDSVIIYNNPTIDFTFDTSAGCYPFPVDFTNLSTYEGAVEFDWDFGDGSTSIQENPNHVYLSNGKFDVALTLRTTDKCIDTLGLVKQDAIDISLDSSKNKIDFDFFPKEGCPDLLVQFSDSSFTEGGADYAWDFGTGLGSFDQNPTNTYTDTGYYSVGLILFATTKCIDTLRMTIDSAIRVLPEPIADIQASDSALTLKMADFRFDATASQFVDQGRFMINGVEQSQDSVLEYHFSDTGTYKVDYIATNVFNCDDTSSVTVLVYDEFEFLIPNIFTPNGDGVNDVFAVRACGVYEYEITIYDRYGLNVFKSNSMNINWDGRVNGVAPNSGVFFYAIRIKDFRGVYLDYQGELTLIAD